MYLLDTNVVSELRKVRSGRADARVAAWAEGVPGVDLYTSVIVMQEIEIGVMLVERRDASQGAVLRRWYETIVLPGFADRILPVDLAVARCGAELHVPDPRPARDALILATALVHRLTAVTRNVADFDDAGVEVLNPWEGMATG